MGDTMDSELRTRRTHYEGCWRHEGHHACAVTMVEQLWTKVEQLCHELHNEQVRHEEWEKMYNQAIADQAVGDTEIERLRERVEHWKHISLKVAQIERSKQLAEVERLLKTALDSEVDSRVSAELEVERLQAKLKQVKQTRDEARNQVLRTLEEVRRADNASRVLAVEIKQLRQDHHDERVKRGKWEKKAYDLTSTEIEQLQAELALTRVKLNRVRQDAQDQSDEVQELWLSPCEAEGLRQQLAQAVVAQADAELAAHTERELKRTERSRRREVETGYLNGHKALTAAGVAQTYASGEPITLASRVVRLRKCTERAEALAALVTPEWANLLTWLAIDIEILREHFIDTFDNDDQRDVKVKTARALAARIREALEETE